MMVLRRTGSVTAWCERFRAAGLSVGFVPTMGALHAGHVSLIRQARIECDRVVVSIFVNPTQFGPGEDLAAYPVTTEADLEACRGAGADLVFLGAGDDVYPPGFQTWVTVDELSRVLCGKSRPLHFRGVATVVTQLFQIVKPHRAYFGLKDYQQTRVISRMSRDLHLDVEIRARPTVREPDGLAMSSRNAYLEPPARATAARLHRALRAAEALVVSGELRVDAIRGCLLEVMAPGADLSVDYAEVLDAETLAPFEGGIARRNPGGILLAVAARVGRARLIDNVVVPPQGAAPGVGAGDPRRAEE